MSSAQVLQVAGEFIYLLLYLLYLISPPPSPLVLKTAADITQEVRGGGGLYIAKKMVFIKSSVKLKLELKNFQI